MSPWISVHHCQDFYSYLDKDNHLNKESFPSFGVEVEIQPSSGFGSHEGGDCGRWMRSGSICSISIYKYPSRFCVSGIWTPYSGETQPSSPSQSTVTWMGLSSFLLLAWTCDPSLSNQSVSSSWPQWLVQGWACDLSWANGRPKSQCWTSVGTG